MEPDFILTTILFFSDKLNNTEDTEQRTRKQKADCGMGPHSPHNYMGLHQELALRGA